MIRGRVTCAAVLIAALATACSAAQSSPGQPSMASSPTATTSSPSVERTIVDPDQDPLSSNPSEDRVPIDDGAKPDDVLMAAALEGDADRVSRALRAGANTEGRDAAGRTPLLLAASGDHIDSARILVAHGADPDALDDRHDTPWLVTGVTGSVAMLEVLLPANPDLTIVNRYGGVSVIPASERGHVDYVRRVVSTGIDVNHVNNLGWTALLEAVILADGGQGPRLGQGDECLGHVLL